MVKTDGYISPTCFFHPIRLHPLKRALPLNFHIHVTWCWNMGNHLTKTLAIDVTIQLVGWIIASKLQTEKFFDTTGSSTIILLVVESLISNGRFFPRQVIQSGMVSMWAVRLGLFLLSRILRDGKDARFDKVRGNPKLFLLFWGVQG